MATVGGFNKRDATRIAGVVKGWERQQREQSPGAGQPVRRIVPRAVSMVRLTSEIGSGFYNGTEVTWNGSGWTAGSQSFGGSNPDLYEVNAATGLCTGGATPVVVAALFREASDGTGAAWCFNYGVDIKVKIDSSDTTAGYLDDKLDGDDIWTDKFRDTSLLRLIHIGPDTTVDLTTYTLEATTTALTENSGAIGGTNDGNLPALVDPNTDAGATVIAGIRECATKINTLVNAIVRTYIDRTGHFLSIDAVTPSGNPTGEDGPEDVPSGDPGPIWWIGARFESYTDGQEVTTAADQIGSNDATGATGPTFKENIVNGKPVFRFTGTEQLGCGSIITGTNPRTIFVVYKTDDDSSADRPMLQLNNSASIGAGEGYSITAEPEVRCNGATAFTTSSGTAAFRILMVRNGAGEQVQNIEGWLELTALTNSSVSANAINTAGSGAVVGHENAGAAGFYDGDIAEMIAYDSELSDADCTIVVNYLKNIYGL